MTDVWKCAECGADGARSVIVTYINEQTESIQLCEDCTSEFEDGSFVERVERLAADISVDNATSGSSCQSDP